MIWAVVAILRKSYIVIFDTTLETAGILCFSFLGTESYGFFANSYLKK